MKIKKKEERLYSQIDNTLKELGVKLTAQQMGRLMDSVMLNKPTDEESSTESSQYVDLLNVDSIDEIFFYDSPVACVICDDALRVLKYNHKIAHLLSKDLLDKHTPFIRLVDPNYHDVLNKSCHRLQENKDPISFELSLLTDGISIPVKVDLNAYGKKDVRVYKFIIYDLREQKSLERALAEKEFQYRMLANASVALIWVSGKDKLCYYFNDSWLKFTGRKLEQEVGSGWTEGVHPDDFEQCLNTYVAAFDKQESFDMEYRIRHASGEYRWIRDLGVPNYNAFGEFIGYIGHCFDISESKKMAIALKHSEDKFRGFFEKHTAIQLIIDPKTGDIMEANEAASKFYGWSIEELTSMNISQINTRSLDEIKGYINDSHPKGEFKYEFTHRKADGTTAEVEVNGCFITSEGATVIHTITHDVSEKKKADNQLRLLSRSVEQNPVSIVITDASGNIEYVNPAFCRITGYSEEELLGGNPRVLKSDYHSTEFYQDFWKTILSGKEWKGVLQNKRKNGQLYWEEAIISPIFDDKGEIHHFVGVKEDITERKQNLEELLQAKVRAEESESKFRRTIEFLPIPIAVADNNRVLSFLNNRFNETYGYYLKDTSTIDALFELAFPDQNYRQTVKKDWEKMENHLEYNNITTKTREFLFTCKNGDVKTVEASLYFENDLYIASIQDVTSKKAFEKALRKNQELFTQLLKNTPVYTYIKEVTPIESKVLMVSDNFIEMVGISADEMIGKNMHEIFPVEFADKILSDDWSVVSKGEVVKLDETLNGNYYTTIKFPINLEDSTLLAGFTIDITERVKNELLLIEKNRQIELQNIDLQLAKLKSEEREQILKVQKAEIELSNERLEGLLRISQFSTNSIQELLDFALSEAVALTSSKIGYIYFYNESTHQFVLNSWSKDVMKECAVVDAQTFYDLDKTGCWGEAVRQRRPIVLNDYQAANPLKKGIPEGHVKLEKFMTIPVIFDDKIVAVAGVANKLEDYNNSDIRQLTLLMDNVWKISERLILIEQLEVAKEKTEYNEQRLIEAQAIAKIGHWELDLVSNNLNWSDEVYRIFELDRTFDSLSLQNFVELIFPEDRELVINAFKLHLEKKDPYNVVHRILLKDGTFKYLNERCITEFDQENKPIRSIGTVADITERVQVENELKIAKEKAEESDRLKSAFLQNMSHEIRTPMNGILGFMQLLKEPNLNGEEKDSYMKIMEKSGQRLLTTINDIIEISRIESGQTELNVTVVDTQDLMNYYAHFFKPMAVDKKLELINSSNFSGKEGLIHTDKHKLEAIISNLLNNALKFTVKGKVEFGNYIQGNEMLFYVKDTGAGIAVERVNAIFDRFVQADLNLTRPHEGSGLGLSIVKYYVEMLGGRIWVESEINVGSSFTFALPYIQTKDNNETVESMKPKSEVEDEKLKLLIAEDDNTSFLYLSMILKKADFEIARTVTGSETVEYLRNNRDVAIVLMDIKMPDMDGLEATAKIRTFNKEVLIIAQTAFALMGDREKAIEAGCNDYIKKPIKRDDLFVVINKLLDR